MQKKTTRIASYLVALLSSLTLLRLRRRLTCLWSLKMLSGALTPFLALIGGLETLRGLLHRDWKRLWAGLFGASVAVRHIIRVTAPHDHFTSAFGPNWRGRIPSHLRAHMLPRRYTPLPSDPPSTSWQRDLVFGTHIETDDPLLCDLWQPPEETPRTGLAVIYLHSSGWHYLDKDTYTRRFFRHLTSQGHVVMDVAYTLSPKAQLQAMVADVKRAIAWMKANAHRYSVNPERIVLMGGSAGGHLALLTAYATNHPAFQTPDVDTDTSVRAVVSYYGPTDLIASHRYLETEVGDILNDRQRPRKLCLSAVEAICHCTHLLPPYGKLTDVTDLLPSLCGGTPAERPEHYRLGSPINHVGPHCPPTLLLQGAHDTLGMATDVRRLHDALQRAGVPSVYVEFPNTDHIFDLILPKWAPAAQAATYDTERFLALMI